MTTYSEAEYERLYQEFIRNGGGNPTLGNNGYIQNADGTFTRIGTPATYYDEASSVNLTPQQLADLQAQQAHYNRTQALQTISSEIGANNFFNPYDARSASAIAKFNALGTSEGAIAIAAINNLIGSDTAVLLALSEAFDVDFEKVLLIAGLTGAAVSMFGDLQNHTNSQVADLPGTLEQAGQLADMNKQFGVQQDSCSMLNELVGILAGALDGVLDFIEIGADKLLSLLGEVAQALVAMAAALPAAIAGGIAAIIDAISDLLPDSVKDVLKQIGNVASSVFNAIAEMANQILKEVANLAEMAASLAAKLAALALAAAMLDPCRMAVILNTGSPEMVDAVNKVNAPVTGGAFPTYTETDPRANQADVEAALSAARQAAQTAPGVPQSPLTEAAKQYAPFNAYLHDLQTTFPSIFGTDDVFENIKSGTDTMISSLPKTGSTSASNNTQDTTQNREFESRAMATWKSVYLEDMLTKRAQNNVTRNQIETALADAHFPNGNLKTEAVLLKETSDGIEQRIKKHLNDVRTGLSYTSTSGQRVEQIEQMSLEDYNNIWNPRSKRFFETISRDLNNMRSTWLSIQSQIIM